MTVYKNDYAPVQPLSVGDTMSIPPEAYDLNFVFPVKLLSSDRVQLRPFVPTLHAQPLYDGLMKYPEVQKWLPMQTETLEDVLKRAETMRRQPDMLQYAIYTDKPGSDTPKTDPSNYEFAGTLCFMSASADDLVGEPGWIIIFPPYQRTHVLTHAAGLIMRFNLNMPSEGGLGLRRCQWHTTSLNTASQRAGLRLGFTFEGIIRNHRVLAPGKTGIREGRLGDSKPGQMSRDSWLASVTWKDWEDGVREKLNILMARR